MPDVKAIDMQNVFCQVFDAASQLPGVNINREKYLRGALAHHFTPEVVAMAVETSPAQAGIDPEKLDSIAKASIKYEAAKVTALSTAAGIPGGMATVGTASADVVQYFAHVIRIAQKLAYLYGWEDFFDSDEEMDDETSGMLILFIGVMFGAQGAGEGVEKIAAQAAVAAAKRIPQKALADLPIYRVLVKPVAHQLGVQMNKEIFGKGVGKIIPVIGAIVSGGITLATYAPMCFKLKDYLSKLELANPESFVVEVEAEDVEELFFEE